MRKVLFITRNNPFGRTGGSYATRSYMEALIEIFQNKITIILADSCLIDQALPEELFIKVPERNPFLRLLSFFTGSLHRFKKATIKYLHQSDQSYKICVFDGSLIAGDMLHKIQQFGLKSITIHHNFEREYHIDNKTIETLGGRFPYYVNRNEKIAYLRSDMNLFLTRKDLEIFEEEYGGRLNNHILGVYENRRSIGQTIPDTAFNSDKIVFAITGALDSLQTEDGIIYFFEELYPVLEELPSLQILIAGKNPSKRIIQLCSQYPDVELIANPESMNDILRFADIYVCPTRTGGGLKVRIMDGLRMGLPILTHLLSARGYDFISDNLWFRTFEKEESFKEGVETIVNQIRNKQISKHDITMKYLDQFSFDAGTRRFSDFIDKIDVV